MYCAAFVPPDAVMGGIAGSRLTSEPRPRPDAMCYPEPSASTVYAFLAVQMHYQMQMQMHDRLAKGGLSKYGAPGRTRTDTRALLGGQPLPLGYGGAIIVPFFRYLSGN